MRHGVDDGLGYHLLGNLVGYGGADALGAGADVQRDLAQHKIYRVIDQIKDRALIDLVGWNRLGDFCSVEVGAFDLGGDQKPLWRFSEQQHGSVGQPPVVQQVQMGQQFLGRCFFGQGELPHPARSADEPTHSLTVEIVQCRVRAGSRVEWPPADQLLVLQILDQRGVEFGFQFFCGVEPLSDQSGLGLADQRPHFGMPGTVVLALDEDQAVDAEGTRMVELPFRRRNVGTILAAIAPAEQSYIDVATLDFIQIERVWPLVRGRGVFKQEHVEKSAQQRIAENIIAQRRSLLDELALHAADE